MAYFGDPSLFSEFEKPKGPSDRLLKQNVLSEGKSQGFSDVLQGDSDDETSGNVGKVHMTDNDAGRKSSSSDSSSDDSDGGTSDDNDEEIPTCSNRSKNGDCAAKIQSSSLSGSGGTLGDLVSDNRRTKELLKTIKNLKQENDFLKKQVRLLDPLLWIKDEHGPVMQLIFMHHDFAREHKGTIESFIADLIAQSNSQKKRSMGVVRPRPNDICLASVKDLSDPMKRILRLRTSMILNCSQVYEDFMIDMTGSPLVDFNPSLTDGWEVPVYEQVYTQSLPCNEDDEDACPPRSKAKNKSKCFNCGGDHTLANCPEEKDFAKIRQNKQEFMANSTPRQERYHVEDPRFASFKPGLLSDDLRAALGLSNKQLPPYIYQMRALGYPPGWLEEAKKETGLAMYDREGRELDKDGELLEDGEMNEERVVTRDEYHLEKFVEYPGFNAPVPSGVMDEWQNFGAFPQQPGQDISEMKRHYGGNSQAGQKRKSNGESHGSAKRRKHVDMSASDMDVGNSDTEEGGLPSSQDSTAPSTPSMEELEKQRELLEQALLASTEESSQDTVPMTPSRADTVEATEGTSLGTVLSATPSGPSIASSLGTPILVDIGEKRTSLPDPKKFQKDIEEHIPFENLPDSEGNYEKLRALFSKIKDEKKRLSL